MIDWQKYGSRKLIVVATLGISTTLLALLGKMTGDVASVFASIAIIYPASQAYLDSRK